MFILVGLGNPERKYANNRHNVGFMFIDYVLSRYQKSNLPVVRQGIKYRYDKYLQSETAEIPIDDERVLLVKPQTFMNASGIAVFSCVSRYRLQVSRDLFIIHDDLDIPFGLSKIQKGAGPKLHNGIESIEKHLKTKDFLRVRIGVDNRSLEHRIEGETYVLQDFTNEEKNMLTADIFPKILERLKNHFFASP